MICCIRDQAGVTEGRNSHKPPVLCSDICKGLWRQRLSIKVRGHRKCETGGSFGGAKLKTFSRHKSTMSWLKTIQKVFNKNACIRGKKNPLVPYIPLYSTFSCKENYKKEICASLHFLLIYIEMKTRVIGWFDN